MTLLLKAKPIYCIILHKIFHQYSFPLQPNEEDRLVYIEEGACYFFLQHDIIYNDRCGDR